MTTEEQLRVPQIDFASAEDLVLKAQYFTNVGFFFSSLLTNVCLSVAHRPRLVGCRSNSEAGHTQDHVLSSATLLGCDMKFSVGL